MAGSSISRVFAVHLSDTSSADSGARVRPTRSLALFSREAYACRGIQPVRTGMSTWRRCSRSERAEDDDEDREGGEASRRRRRRSLAFAIGSDRHRKRSPSDRHRSVRKRFAKSNFAPRTLRILAPRGAGDASPIPVLCFLMLQSVLQVFEASNRRRRLDLENFRCDRPASIGYSGGSWCGPHDPPHTRKSGWKEGPTPPSPVRRNALDVQSHCRQHMPPPVLHRSDGFSTAMGLLLSARCVTCIAAASRLARCRDSTRLRLCDRSRKRRHL